MTARLLGPIALLQVQRGPLKVKGVSYDPSGILAVEEAAVGPGGMVGRVGDQWVVDAHHSAHPASRAGGRRPLSIGFTGHYDLMDRRFGGVPAGIAGENVVVEDPGRVTENDLQGTIVVRTGDGDLELVDARVAAPCAEFTSFLLRLPAVLPKSELGEDVAFLDDGMRGFVVATGHLERSIVVRVGDEVWVRPR